METGEDLEKLSRGIHDGDDEEARRVWREFRAAQAAAAAGPVITEREAAQAHAVPPHFTEDVAEEAALNGMGGY